MWQSSVAWGMDFSAGSSPRLTSRDTAPAASAGRHGPCVCVALAPVSDAMRACACAERSLARPATNRWFIKYSINVRMQRTHTPRWGALRDAAVSWTRHRPKFAQRPPRQSLLAGLQLCTRPSMRRPCCRAQGLGRLLVGLLLAAAAAGSSSDDYVEELLVQRLPNGAAMVR